MAVTKQINSLSALNKKSDKVSRSDSFSIAPELLVEEDGFNIRDYSSEDVADHIESLTQSYLNGIFVPPIVVVVKNGKSIVRDGHCRRLALLEAIKRGAQIKKVQVIDFRGDEADQSALILTSNQGMKLNPLERGAIYLRLSRWGLSNKEIASKVSKSEEHVRQLLTLQSIPLKLKDMIKKKVISSTYALEVWSEHGDEAVEILTQAQDDAASIGKERVTKARVQSTGTPQKRMSKKLSNAMQSSFSSIYDRLKNIEIDESDENVEVTLKLSKKQIEEMLNIGQEINDINQARLKSFSS